MTTTATTRTRVSIPLVKGKNKWTWCLMSTGLVIKQGRHGLGHRWYWILYKYIRFYISHKSRNLGIRTDSKGIVVWEKIVGETYYLLPMAGQDCAFHGYTVSVLENMLLSNTFFVERSVKSGLRFELAQKERLGHCTSSPSSRTKPQRHDGRLWSWAAAPPRPPSLPRPRTVARHVSPPPLAWAELHVRCIGSEKLTCLIFFWQS